MTMQEFAIDCSGVNAKYMVVSENTEACLRAIINVLMNHGEQICILKKTYAGNTHDENWQNHLFILNGDVWADKLDTIAKEGRGWFWDSPIVDHYDDVSAAINEWVRYYADPESYEAYTCKTAEGITIRRKFRLACMHPEKTDYRRSEGNVAPDTTLSEPVTCWFVVLDYEENVTGAGEV